MELNRRIDQGWGEIGRGSRERDRHVAIRHRGSRHRQQSGTTFITMVQTSYLVQYDLRMKYNILPLIEAKVSDLAMR